MHTVLQCMHQHILFRQCEPAGALVLWLLSVCHKCADSGKTHTHSHNPCSGQGRVYHHKFHQKGNREQSAVYQQIHLRSAIRGRQRDIERERGRCEKERGNECKLWAPYHYRDSRDRCCFCTLTGNDVTSWVKLGIPIEGLHVAWFSVNGEYWCKKSKRTCREKRHRGRKRGEEHSEEESKVKGCPKLNVSSVHILSNKRKDYGEEQRGRQTGRDRDRERA